MTEILETAPTAPHVVERSTASGGITAVDKRIASLDGLRAISIVLVMTAHWAWGWPSRWDTWKNLLVVTLRLGPLGVSVFFVISGFLITTLLLEEKERTGTIKLRYFYARRFLRILPAYFTLLLVIAGMAALGWIPVTARSLVVPALFMTDYFPQNWWLEHTWSLSVEEKFYLLWPAVVMLTPRRWIASVTIGILLASPVIRVASYFLVPQTRGAEGTMFHLRLDTIMFGCLLAVAWAYVPRERLLRWVGDARLAAACLVVVFVVSPILDARWHGKYTLPLGASIDGAAIAVIVIWAVLRATSPVGRVLNSPVATRIGVWSYSLYLFQQLIFDPHSSSWTATFPFNWVLTVLVAYASYRWLESPFLRMRRHFRA